jgi:hypothetical protein
MGLPKDRTRALATRLKTVVLVQGPEDITPHLLDRLGAHHEEMPNCITAHSTPLVGIKPVIILLHLSNLLHAREAAFAWIGWRDDPFRIGIHCRLSLIILNNACHRSLSFPELLSKSPARTRAPRPSELTSPFAWLLMAETLLDCGFR